MTTQLNTPCALISVYDKQALSELASALSSLGVAIIATGNTYKQLNTLGVAVSELSDYTNFPEIMDGRVKSLHPKIYGGILARRQQDEQILKEYHIQTIDFVICNFYPFQETIHQNDCKPHEAIEQIDIGGPTMVRAAAKNYQDVTVVTDPNDYPLLIKELKTKGQTSLTTRHHLACKAFKLIADYDTAISEYFLAQTNNTSSAIQLPSLNIQTQQALRYGENPHQQAASFTSSTSTERGILQANLHQGKPLSYNNLIDGDATFNIIRTLSNSSPTCVIVKHATPCGVASDKNLSNAYLKAYQCDPESAFGGIIGINRILTKELAQIITDQQFTEVILAPAVTDEAHQILKNKANLRVLSFGDSFESIPTLTHIRSISGGIIAQQPDWQPLTINDLNWVTETSPSQEQQQDALFAWDVVKHVKSNAIVFAKNQQTIGIGSGQTSRIFSAKIAALRAKQVNLSLTGSVMASDAFFPFADSIDLAHEYGIDCIIQPGGSKRDKEVIMRANQLNITMAFTHFRHFLH
ncbi:MAG: bifunctional phosphoribosylaminoimidazolecarboxamide formyltransferase/inosine monophosphate cyclohydrolase [Coxiellaceae bacterium]|nr:bifunctional phosphoribosylaminoimidazolecarboxamide formyltransferase/inosine monophosphate cyclohydrolase [Coxiellaceae bacterium]|tara:strand:+ start:7202 stop:8773 length:1572 start_codon:yes stop_codon:yes gene_type:complete